MLRLSSSYINRSILSLRTGGKIGVAIAPIINPNNLKIEGWYSQDMFEKGEVILPVQEVRDFIAKGLVVNDHDALTPPVDLIRLKEVLDIRFDLPGKTVTTESGKKLGKVADYAVDDSNYYIQKLYVNPPILRGLTDEQLLIDRSQVVEITDKKILVADQTVQSGAVAPIQAQA
jgi:sporulation protein YlmC with PRC-barrel domain